MIRLGQTPEGGHGLKGGAGIAKDKLSGVDHVSMAHAAEQLAKNTPLHE